MDLRPDAETMSLDGRSLGTPIAGRTPSAPGGSTYGLFPNVLLSLHPDYVMVHRLVPLAEDRR